MEFKEVIKIRRRMCDYYEGCSNCPLKGFLPSCINGIFKVETSDIYERILEEWAREHPFVTNADKFVEVIKNTFGADVEKMEAREICIRKILGIECSAHCPECMKWWDEEYKPVKDGEVDE